MTKRSRPTNTEWESDVVKAPEKQGLYDPRNEHDACGMGFVANIKGEQSNAIIRDGLQILANLDHRGAVGADPLVGDGAGCLIQIPDALFRAWASEASAQPAARRRLCGRHVLPAAGRRRAATPRSRGSSASSRSRARSCSAGATCRSDDDWPRQGGARIHAGRSARRSSRAGPRAADQDAFERKLLAIRKQTLEPAVGARARSATCRASPTSTSPSFSSRTLVYKGLLLATQVGSFYTRPRRPADKSGAGDGPPAFLDQHLPELEAGAPLSLHRPQWRDQHGARQRELDERAPAHAGIAACSAPTSTRCGRSSRTASRTPPASTMRSSCCSPAAIRWRMR